MKKNEVNNFRQYHCDTFEIFSNNPNRLNVFHFFFFWIFERCIDNYDAANFMPNCHFEYIQQSNHFHLTTVTLVIINKISLEFLQRKQNIFKAKMMNFESFSEDLIPRIVPQPTLHPVLVSKMNLLE